MCHAADKRALFQEPHHFLKNGSAFFVTDIINADGTILKDFTDRHATTRMAHPAEYIAMLREAGFKNASFNDFLAHLELYFCSMVDQIYKHYEEMFADGVPAVYLEKWPKSLTSRVEIQKNRGIFSWDLWLANDWTAHVELKTQQKIDYKHAFIGSFSW